MYAFYCQSLTVFLNNISTYKYCKYRNPESFSLETGPAREISLESSNAQPRYIVISDGMLRVSHRAYIENDE